MIPEPGQHLTESALKAELRSALPPYMVPTAIGFFDVFPLNASQKVDRAQLAGQFAQAVARTGTGGAVALSTHERRVAAIWQQVLHRPGIGRDDNFFDSGGNSMLLMQVHQLLTDEAADPSLTVSELFRYPTVASLAARLSRVPAAAPGPARRTPPPADDTVRGARLRARQRNRRNAGGDTNA